ncbi:MAG: hypothetical protein EA413_07185 [Cyanobium sp. PLM2.Bin73]|nr:MAG: hypothetical protein EA413_07185 [Cyanobium sp. PLM2.Bin73]
MTRLIRPLYLLLAGMALLDQVQNVRDIARLPLTLFGSGSSLGLTQTSHRAMALIFRYTVVGLGMLLVLSNLGLNATAVVAVAAGLGFGVKEISGPIREVVRSGC